MAAPIIPEPPVTSAVFRASIRSSAPISAISSNLVQRLEDQYISGPTGVVARDIPVQRVGNRALHQRTQRTGRVEVNFQAVELAELERLIQVARPRIAVH